MRKGWVEQVVTPIAAALLAVLGSFWATTLANDTATNNQKAVFAEQRAQIERDKRDDAYVKFLEATDKFARVLTAAHLCSAGQVTDRARCDSIAADVHIRFGELANAANLVRIYGSSTANGLMDSILQLLPRIYALSDTDFRDTVNKGLDGPEYTRRLTDFQRNMCMELPANPRPDC